MASTKTATVTDLQPQLINLCFTREDSFPFTFNLQQGGSAIDLTGSSFLLTVHDSPDADAGGSQQFQISESNTPDTTGDVTFTPTQANMDLAQGTYFYEVEWTDSLSNVRTVISGEFIIGPQLAAAP